MKIKELIEEEKTVNNIFADMDYQYDQFVKSAEAIIEKLKGGEKDHDPIEEERDEKGMEDSRDTYLADNEI